MYFPEELWYHILSFLNHGKVQIDNTVYTYFLGIKKGQCITRYDDEDIVQYSYYKDDKLDGLYVAYQYDKLTDKGYYKDGKLTGLYKEYYSIYGENICRESKFLFDKKYGKFIEYYVNNKKIRQEGIYVNNILHGDYIAYYENGNKYITFTYYAGKVHGEYKVYKSDGILSQLSIYNHGKLQNGSQSISN